MGLRDENVKLLKRNGQLEGELSAIKRQLAETQAELGKRIVDHESLLMQAGEINECSSNLNREIDKLRYEIPRLEEQLDSQQGQISKLLDESKRDAESIRDLSAAIKSLTSK